MSNANICRENNWTVGDILEADEGCGPLQIVLTAIGEESVLACQVSKDIKSHAGMCELEWDLSFRVWKKVGRIDQQANRSQVMQLPVATDKHEVRILRLAVVPKGVEIFNEGTTNVEIEDENAGEFVTVAQHTGSRERIAIDPSEWPTLRAAIDYMIGQCRAENDEKLKGA